MPGTDCPAAPSQVASSSRLRPLATPTRWFGTWRQCRSRRTRICLERLEATLKQEGCSLAGVVKVNCYLSEDSYRSEFWRTYDEILVTNEDPAVCITQIVGIACECRVELDAIAVAPTAV
ncbi:RidA family protein [Rhodococcus koreensis]